MPPTFNKAVPTVEKQQPQPISIEQYLKRQQRRAEEKLTAIPATEKPKRRRAGRIVKLRKELADLKRRVTAEVPPPWELACELWQRIDTITSELKKKNISKT